MMHGVRHFIIEHDWLLCLVRGVYRFINRKSFEKRIHENIRTDIFDIETLARDIPFYPVDKVIDNNYYGISYSLKQYSGIPYFKSLDATIEHGLFLGNLVRKDDRLYHVHNILTLGEFRKNVLTEKQINKNIIQIGTYIYYASLILSDKELLQLKTKLGKVLLVFPSHSTKGIDAEYDVDALIKEIETRKSNFDNVLICLFWRDVNAKKVVECYKKKGYLLTCAGHFYDINFLSRLRTIISLADMTMSNSVGTHIGYCICLNKPHYVYNQLIRKKATNDKVLQHNQPQRTEEEWISAEKNIEKIYTYFSEYRDSISEEQKYIVDEYWGISSYLSPKEIYDKLMVGK